MLGRRVDRSISSHTKQQSTEMEHLSHGGRG
jgi:hypothetical protein